MFGTLIRAAERWRGLRFTEFELRQIAAVPQICALTAVGRDSSLFGNPSFLVLLRKIPCSPA
jgi:hypothetical protein